MFRSALLALAVAGAAPAMASNITLENLTVGQTVHGPALSLKDMKGKVVFVDYWGTR